MLNKLQEGFERLVAREKIIVIVAIFFSLWGMWDTFFYQPMQKKHTTLQQELSSLDTQLTTLKATATQLENHPQIDPNQGNQAKLTTLKASVQNQQEQLLLGHKKFVPPQLMAKALSDMLNHTVHTQLIKLEILPVTPLLLAKQQRLIYKHGLALTFTGGYVDTVNYLKALEALPWHFNWDSIEYKVTRHPLAETTLRVYTLSFEKDWLGV
ncbi:MAG: hypothetical protein HOP02_14830 [Methylococcaceae bacterium]|nr:hypothetical protein [Methylococcaceae bacterium]